MLTKEKLTGYRGGEHLPMSKKMEFFWLNFGAVIIAVGVYFFKFPNHFSIGGVSGISIILNYYFPSIPSATINTVLNALLLLVGFAFFGKSFGFKTFYVNVVMNGLIQFLQYVHPMSAPITDQPLLELIFAVALPGIGAGILFNVAASSGGTDIIAMIIKRYTNKDIGKALLITDIIIVLIAYAVFGSTTGLLSLVGLCTKTIFVDSTLTSINRMKYFTIITDASDEVREYITVNLHRGGTQLVGQGLFSGSEKYVFLVVVNDFEAKFLREFVLTVDEKAFMTVVNTSEIIGKGFHYQR